MDREMGSMWHVVVGEAYTTACTVEVKPIKYTYFIMNHGLTMLKMFILLWTIFILLHFIKFNQLN